MKFILGVVVGVAGVWLYRARGQQDPSSAAELFPPATEVIDTAPILPQVQDAATEVTSPDPETTPAAETTTRKRPARASRPRDQSV